MAELTACRNNALPYPVYAMPWVVVLPILDADGDPVIDGTIDSLVSANCNTEAAGATPVQIATNSGKYSLILTAAEMTGDIVSGSIGSTTAGAKRTHFVLYPRHLQQLWSGTVVGGSANTITVDEYAPTLDDIWNGCLIVASIDGNDEARIVNDYNGSTKVVSVSPAWNVTPDDMDGYTIYLPEGREIVKADLFAILSTILSEDLAGYLAAAFKMFFNIGMPVLTVESKNQTIDNPTADHIKNAMEAAGGHLALILADTGTLLARLGAWTGSGVNTILGAFRALVNKAAGVATPTDLTTGDGTFTNTTDSLEASRDDAEVLYNTMVTVLNRLGLWTGSGINTILGALRAMANKAAGIVTPTDLSTGGTFTNTTDSLEGIRDGVGAGDSAWTEEQVAQVVAKTALIGVASVTFASPVTAGGDASLVKGMTYRTADGLALTWTVTGYSGPVETGDIPTLRLIRSTSYLAGTVVAEVSVAGTASLVESTLTLTFEITAAALAALTTSPPAREPSHRFQVWADVGTPAVPVCVLEGDANVAPGLTAPA